MNGEANAIFCQNAKLATEKDVCMHLLCSHRCSLSTVAFFVEFWLEIESFLKNFKVICLCPQSGMIFDNREHFLEGKKGLLILDNIWHSCHCDTFYVSASLHQQKNEISNSQKYSRLRCLLRAQCYRQLLYWDPLCITLKIRIWVVAYFFNFFQLFQQQKIFFYKIYFM